MSVFHNNALIGAGAGTGEVAAAEYVIPKSLRFNSGDSAFLSKTFASAGNRRTWTWSGWVKRCTGDASNHDRWFAVSGTSTDTCFFIGFADTDDKLSIQFGYVPNYKLITNAVFRDPSAWYHVVLAVDVTQSAASDKVKVYVNGVEQTSFSTDNRSSISNTDWGINKADLQHEIGKSFSSYLNGYLADVHFVDGQALAPTDFGETRSSDGVWVPKEFTRTSPNNGTTWSSLVSNAASSYPATNLFDGSLSTYAEGTNGGGDVTFSGGTISGTTIEFYGGKAGSSTFSVNGVDKTSLVPSSSGWFTITGVTSITAFAFNRGGPGNYVDLFAIRVDGEILLDDFNNSSGYGRNGFHLNFSDSSTNEALGFDSAPTTPNPDPKKGMDVITYTGNGGTQNIGGLNFEPGLIWIKVRDQPGDHKLIDSVRGASKRLEANTTDVEETATTGITSFNPDGFSLGSSGTVNGNNYSLVAWTWRAGGPAVANSDGAVTSQVSANTDYGFSIVTVTPTATGQTVGHGLSTTPSCIIYKNRDTAGNWRFYHTSLGTSKTLFLNDSGAESTSSDRVTAVTSSTFTLGDIVANDDHVAYCWSEVSGYSKFGSWTGTGSAGLKVTTGFKPRWILIKKSSGSADWLILDTERETDLGAGLYPNESYAEASYDYADLLDDGFTLNTGDLVNASGATYIYAAFADRPGNNWDVNNIVTNEGLSTSKSQFDVVTYTGNGGFQQVGGPVYSATSTVSSPTNVFNGDTSNGGVFNNAEDRVLTAGSITITSSLEIYHNRPGSDGITVNINGTDYVATGLSSTGYHTIPIPGSDLPLTSTGNITIKDNVSGAQSTVYAVRVDGNVLRDNTGHALKFQPDLVWLKGRSYSISHLLYDSVRGFGADKELVPNGTNAEGAAGADSTYGYVSAVSSTGFTVQGGSSANDGYTNKSGATYVAWCWKAGGTAVSNTDGSITSSVSANAAYGFSIVTYTGTGSAATVGHGLSTTPGLVICKDRSASDSWLVWAKGFTSNEYLYLNSTAAKGSYSGTWGSTPTNSVFGVSDQAANQSGNNFVAYCFADVPGYQRIGSYTGNGSSTGPVVVTGFKPRFVLIKRTDSTGNWFLYDNERGSEVVWADLADSASNGYAIEYLSNGFQPKNTSAGMNVSNGNYIYLAIGDDEIGSDEDCLVDVPNAVTADADATDTTGGYQRGNYCTGNPTHPNMTASAVTLSNGNLKADITNGSNWYTAPCTIGVETGKWYFEQTVHSGYAMVGIAPVNAAFTANNDSVGTHANGIGYFNGTGKKYTNSSPSNYGATYGNGDVIGCAFDMDAQTVEFYKNGVSQGVISSAIAADLAYAPVFSLNGQNGAGSYSWNFGQMRFKYPMPSGYAALNTTALPAATIPDGSAHFDVDTYAGTGASHERSEFSFSPDWVWIKSRTSTNGHNIYDAVRGANKYLSSHLTTAEGTATNELMSFDSDGFTLNDAAGVNGSSKNYVAWAWNAGSSTVSNTDGSITSSVRANPSAGFSIVSYTGNGSSGTVGHGLNAAPEMIIAKDRDASTNWFVYHTSLGSNAILLNSTAAAFSPAPAGINAASSSTFTLGGARGETNTNGNDYIAYCISPVSGFSAVGSYTGNGSNDGPFVYTGFMPRWLMIKRTNSTSNWVIVDAARSSFNEVNDLLYAEQSLAETVDDGNNGIDFLSNGFKLRKGVGGTNVNGATLIYIAFASNPFQANGGLAR